MDQNTTIPAEKLHQWRDKIPAHLRKNSRIVVVPWNDVETGRLIQLFEEVTSTTCKDAGELDKVLKNSGASLLGTDSAGVEYELPERPAQS